MEKMNFSHFQSRNYSFHLMIEISNKLYEMVESMTRCRMKLCINNFYTSTKTIENIQIENKEILFFFYH